MDADPSQEYATHPFRKDPFERWFPSWLTLKEILDYPHWDMQVLITESPEDKEGLRIKYRDRCKEFLEVFVPGLQSMTDQAEDLRIVFHFY